MNVSPLCKSRQPISFCLRESNTEGKALVAKKPPVQELEKYDLVKNFFIFCLQVKNSLFL